MPRLGRRGQQDLEAVVAAAAMAGAGSPPAEGPMPPPHFGNQDTVSTFVVTPQADGNITRAELLLKVIPIHLTRTDGRQFQ